MHCGTRGSSWLWLVTVQTSCLSVRLSQRGFRGLWSAWIRDARITHTRWAAFAPEEREGTGEWGSVEERVIGREREWSGGEERKWRRGRITGKDNWGERGNEGERECSNMVQYFSEVDHICMTNRGSLSLIEIFKWTCPNGVERDSYPEPSCSQLTIEGCPWLPALLSSKATKLERTC